MLVSEEKRGEKLSDNSSNNFPFIKLPRALIDDPNFSGLSAEAKLLFSLILDRMGVSQITSMLTLIRVQKSASQTLLIN